MKFVGMNEISSETPVGTKAFQFKRLIDSGLNISPFFVATGEFYEAILEANDAKTEMGFLKTKLKSGFSGEVLERMANLVSNLKFPTQLVDELYKRYLKLGHNPSSIKSAFDLVKQNREGFVAVRASDPNPFLDTYTNIKGKEELLKAIKLCWASFFSQKAYDYKVKHPSKESISLIIQNMVITEKAGEVDSPEAGVLRIKACWGQTGFIAQTNPDIYFVSRAELQISSKTIGLQKDIFIFDKEKESFIKKGLPEEASESQVLGDNEVIDIARLAGKIFDSSGLETLEFGISHGKIFIINVRGHKKGVEMREKPLNEQDKTPEMKALSEEPANAEASALETPFQEVKEPVAEDWDFLSGVQQAQPEPKMEERLSEGKESAPAIKEGYESPGFPKEFQSSEQTSKLKEETPEFPSIETKPQPPFDIRAIDAIFQKYIIINPNLKEVLELLKAEILKELE